ncbi:MAG: PLP-dependent aspartate aminotransferase family protein [Actinomycetota bacterium]
MSTDRPALRPDTVAVRTGRGGDAGTLAPSIVPTTTWASDTVDEAHRKARRPRSPEFYSRFGNPGVQAFADAVAELEGADAGVSFASGMGAVSSTILALCSSGSHVVAQRQLFAATHQLFTGVCARFGIEVTLVDGTDADAIEAAVEPGRTQVVFVETPANPVMAVVDLQRIGAITGPITVVDSTFATPVVQRPLEIPGIDLVVHSATKGLAGHNDATLGVAVGDRELVNWIWGYSTIHGATASPFDAWNGLRGLRTLGIRVRRQCETAHRLAELLCDRDEVAAVHYPGLAGHPQADVVARQMDLGGGCLSFDLRGGLDAGRVFVEALELAHLAPSLGGPDTLVTHPATMTHASMTPEDRAAGGIGDGLVRLSAGLEHPDDLVADVEQALAVVSDHATVA